MGSGGRFDLWQVGVDEEVKGFVVFVRVGGRGPVAAGEGGSLALGADAFGFGGQEDGTGGLQALPLLVVVGVVVLFFRTGAHVDAFWALPVVGKENQPIVSAHVGKGVEPSGVGAFAEQVGPFGEGEGAPLFSSGVGAFAEQVGPFGEGEVAPLFSLSGRECAEESPVDEVVCLLLFEVGGIECGTP